MTHLEAPSALAGVAVSIESAAGNNWFAGSSGRKGLEGHSAQHLLPTQGCLSAKGHVTLRSAPSRHTSPRTAQHCAGGFCLALAEWAAARPP